jgi:hypothetical protein
LQLKPKKELCKCNAKIGGRERERERDTCPIIIIIIIMGNVLLVRRRRSSSKEFLPSFLPSLSELKL